MGQNASRGLSPNDGKRHEYWASMQGALIILWDVFEDMPSISQFSCLSLQHRQALMHFS